MGTKREKLKHYAPYLNFLSIVLNLLILLLLFTWRNLLTPVLIVLAIFAIPTIIARVQFPMTHKDERDEFITGLVADRTIRVFSSLLLITAVLFSLVLLVYQNQELVAITAVVSGVGVTMAWLQVIVNDGFYQINTKETTREKLWYLPFVIVSIVGITWFLESLVSLFNALGDSIILMFMGSLLVTPLFIWVYRKKMGATDERLQRIVSDSSRFALTLISPIILVTAGILLIVYIITLKVPLLVAAITISYLYLLLYATYGWAYKEVSSELA